MGRLEVANFPCKGCTKREVGCHGKCEDYIASKKRLAEYDKMAGNRELVNYTVPIINYKMSKSRREKLERSRKR